MSEFKKYDFTDMMLVIHESSITHHNKSYGNENNNKYRKKIQIEKFKKFTRKMREESFEAI